MASKFPIKFGRPLTSKVDEHEGECAPTWLNANTFCNRTDGGVTGFFKRVKRLIPGVYLTTGKEFHGIIRSIEYPSTLGRSLEVHSTKGMM